VIASPIDGIVIARTVDVGQTVAASVSAPTLFVIAADMTEMQVNASVTSRIWAALRRGKPSASRLTPTRTTRSTAQSNRCG